MFQGLYSAASGMEVQQQQFDAISNDMANLDTPGYQSTIVGFHDLLYSNGSYGSTVATGAGSAAQIVGRDTTQGAINETGQPLDVAVQGEGFIEVRRYDGSIGLTRNGHLQLNEKRQLTNEQGMLVQPPITIPAGVPIDQVTIGSDGTVAAAGKKVGKISLVTVPAPDGLVADGDSVFSATTASGAIRGQGHHAPAGRARGLERRPGRRDGQDDDRPEGVRDEQPGGPVPAPDALDRQPDQAMSTLPPINPALSRPTSATATRRPSRPTRRRSASRTSSCSSSPSSSPTR